MSEPELSIIDLVVKAKLSSISYFEVSARRRDDAEVEDEPEAGIEEDDSAESSATAAQYLSTARRDDDAAFRVRIRLELGMPLGEVVVDVAAEYELADALASNISEDLMLEYVNEVAVMQLIPYMRQTVADATQKVFEKPFLLPVLQRGEMSFTREDVL